MFTRLYLLMCLLPTQADYLPSFYRSHQFYVDLWDSFVGREDMYRRDGLHLSGKGAAVFAEGLSGAVASGLGKVRYLN